MKINVFHGTSIEKPDSIDEIEDVIIFDNLETGYSDYNAIWFTENKDTAKTFSSYALNKMNEGVQTLLTLELNVEDEKVLRLESNERYCTLDDYEYNVREEREEFYDALQRNGYEILIIEGNYPEGPNANDITVFNESLYNVLHAQILTENGWSHPIKEADLMENVLSKVFFDQSEDMDIHLESS